MIKSTGLREASEMLRRKAQQLQEVSTPEGLATKLTVKHAHLVCPDHGERPRYEAKPDTKPRNGLEDGNVSGTYCCAKLREMAKDEGFNPFLGRHVDVGDPSKGGDRPNVPSTTGNPSGGGTGNATPSK